MGKDDKAEGVKAGWKRLGTTYPFRNGLIKLRRDLVLVGGKRIKFTYHDHPGTVVIVPVTRKGELVMIRQYRYSVDEWCLEVPGGGMHDSKGLSHERVAAKELREELGAEYEKLEAISSFYASDGQSSEECRVFLASGVELSERPEREEGETMQTQLLSASEVVERARNGEIRDGISALSILLCEARLREMGYV